MPKSSLHPLAELYARWALNPLVDIARAISYDVVVRPQHYRSLPENIAGILNDFRFKLGSDPDWPDVFQRTLSFKVLYQVNLASPPVREAALQFYKHHHGEGDRQLVDAFRDAAASFRAQVVSLQGQALDLICDQTRPIFERAVTVLQDPIIARAFGLPPAQQKNWPVGGEFGGDGAYLVAEMTRSLRSVTCLAGFFRRQGKNTPNDRPLMPLLTVELGTDKFIQLQQAAHHGSETISKILLTEGDLASTDIIDAAYQWTKALQKLVPDVARAWKDLDYRARLSDLEWGMAPNPAGDPAPLSTSPLAAQTYTLHGEICCCSGDLDCVPETYVWTDFCTEFCTIA